MASGEHQSVMLCMLQKQTGGNGFTVLYLEVNVFFLICEDKSMLCDIWRASSSRHRNVTVLVAMVKPGLLDLLVRTWRMERPELFPSS